MKKVVALVLLVFTACSHEGVRRLNNRQIADFGQGPPVLVTNSQAQISLNPQVQGLVDSDFVGFSYEKSILSQNFFRPDNAPLIALFSKWGPGILRVGGNTVNATTWDPATGPQGVDLLAGFLRATGWKVIYGLNATTSSPSLTAAEAAYAAQSLGDRLQDFEIGNEPDLYSSDGLKPKLYTFANFLSDWDSYHSAIQAAVPGAIFSGPASAWNNAVYTVPFSSQRGGQVELLTQHYYRANGQVPTSTIDFLLTPDLKLPATLTALNSAAQTNHILGGYRMAETNSYYNGGAPGISNGFGSALWIIEYCFTLAQNGAVGANFHGGGSGTGYTPIGNDTHGNVLGARAEYYGMLFFSMMGPGSLLKTSVTGTASSLMSYAISKSDGSTALALVNNSRSDIVAATINFPAGTTSAQELVLTAASLDAATGFTFGGSAIGSDGSWTPSTQYAVPIVASTATVDVPSGSAILIFFQ